MSENQYGVDMHYVKKNLDRIIRELDCYTPDELQRALHRIADSQVTSLNKNSKKFVSTSYDECSYITKNKKYKVKESLNDIGAYIEDDNGGKILIVVGRSACSHLDDEGFFHWSETDD